MLKTIKVLLMSAILGLSTAALAVVDINAANQEELQTLKGIGAKKAADIIAYREAHGGFKNVEELLNVKGVGKATLEKLRSEIVVEGDKGVAVEQAKSAGVEDKGGEAETDPSGGEPPSASDLIYYMNSKTGRVYTQKEFLSKEEKN